MLGGTLPRHVHVMPAAHTSESHNDPCCRARSRTELCLHASARGVRSLPLHFDDRPASGSGGSDAVRGVGADGEDDAGHVEVHVSMSDFSALEAHDCYVCNRAQVWHSKSVKYGIRITSLCASLASLSSATRCARASAKSRGFDFHH